jgi:hypothetical protein
MSARRELLAWEGRWSMRVAVATFASVALLVASFLVVRSLGGGGEAESLRSLHAHAGSVTLSSVLQAVAFLLLVAPLVFLFRAAEGRSSRMRRQFLPLVVLAPLALGVGAVLNGAAAKDAASDFVAGRSAPSIGASEAAKDCRSERRDDASGFRDEFGGKPSAVADCTSTTLADSSAKNAIDDASLRGLSGGMQLLGAFALAFALIYCSLNAMRVGLLSRFWGSLGIALGVATVLGLFQFTLIWFFYLALLTAGWIPGGRPPAWAAGEAIPWPTPGERAAAELDPPDEKPEAQDEAQQPGKLSEEERAGKHEGPPE